MKFDDLKNKNLIEEYRIEKGEIEHILEAARSDIKTAQHLLNTDVCWAFNIAYNAVLQAGIALMNKKGFRPIGEAKHISVILFLRKALGEKYEAELDRFDQMRRKRHKAVYGLLRNITEYEARETVKFAEIFVKDIVEFIISI